MKANHTHKPIMLSMRLRIMSQILQECGSIDMRDVMGRFGVARATAQRDLDRLCETTDAQRTRGGAILPDIAVDNRVAIDFSKRESSDAEAKTHIAELAIKRLAGSSVVYIDAGTTNLQLARMIESNGWRPVWAVTNDWHIAEVLGRAGIRHELLGGEVDPHSLAISGPTANETLSRFNFDWAILSADAITASGSVRNALPPEAQLKRIAVKNSTRTMLLASTAKFGQSASVEVTTLADFDVWVTDVASREIDSLCEEFNVELLVVF